MRDFHPETIPSTLLRPYLDENRWAIDVRYHTGELALRVDCLEARVLARLGMVNGLVNRDRLRYLILTVAKSVVVRALRMDPPRPGEISKPKTSDLQWPARYDRAKGGILGRTMQMVMRPRPVA